MYSIVHRSAKSASPEKPLFAPSMLKLPLLLLALLPLAFAGKLWNEVCTQSDTKDLPFCDQTAALDTRVDDYVKRVSLSDKAANMHNGATGITSLHIPPYHWGSEGLHGPLQPCVCAPDNSSCRCPTSFPCPSSLGTAFNDTLYFLIGQADGREARAINNLRNHVTQNKYGDGIDYWSPTINMQRDPRCRSVPLYSTRSFSSHSHSDFLQVGSQPGGAR